MSDGLFARLHGDDQAAAIDAVRALAGRGAPVVAVSACLLGVRCRFDGGDRHDPRLPLPPGAALLPVCPEVLAGLGTPRAPARFAADGRIVAGGGRDLTAAFERGAARAAALVRAAGAREAVLKERSPSCGVRQVHGPRGVQPGEGVFARRLREAHVALRSEEDG